MARDLSRLDRWNDAFSRVNDAMLGLQTLRNEWADTWDNFVQDWATRREQYVAALEELIRLQNIYGSWNQPENLRGAKIQQQLDEVESIDFVALRDRVPDLKKVSNPLDDFEPEDVQLEIGEAWGIHPPKPYDQGSR